VQFTPGRRLAEGFPAGVDDVIVMFDGGCDFKAIVGSGIDIYRGPIWGCTTRS